jgi:hypothetical protein
MQFGSIGRKQAALLLPLLMMAAMVAVGASSAHAQLTSDTGRILAQTGRVSVDHAGDLWALTPGSTISTGQVVVTGPDGYAQVELSDHSIIEVFSSSRLVFRPNRANLRDLVDRYLGKIRLQIQHLTDGESPYHVNSPTAVISIRGTVLDVEVGTTTDTTVQVETGLVGVRHRLLPGSEVMVATGQSVTVVANVPLSASAKLGSRLAVAGRIARMAGETIARITGAGTEKSGGSSSPTAKPTSGPGASAGGTSAGANAPAAPPGQDGKGGSTGSTGGGSSTAPPGDVIKP